VLSQSDIEAAAVLAQNRQLSLYNFSRAIFLGRRGYRWQQAPHHVKICDALERVFRGECKRLIINIPPRYSKTELVKCFIAWTLGQAPDSEYIYTSYSGRLAAASSWDIREMVQTPLYQRIYPGVALRNDSQAKDEWRTEAGGIMYSVGAGGTITGYGAGKHRGGFGGCLLIDDPHKADEARSDVMRQNVIEWFQNTFESRKNSPDTPIILVMQRLHEDDLAGFLLDGGNGEEWEHLCLSVIQDDGTALWPEKHNLETLERMEQAAPYMFAGQYRQRPAPPEGGLFKPEKLKIAEFMPQGLTMARGWDLAATEEAQGKKPDWTAGALVGRDDLGQIYICHISRFRGSPLAVEQALLTTAAMDGYEVPISGPQDPGQAGKAQAFGFIQKLAGYDVEFTPETGSKATRAAPLAAQVEAGNVFMVRGEWNQAFVDELRMFPNGSFDDQVDACSRAFHRLLTAKRWSFGSV